MNFELIRCDSIGRTMFVYDAGIPKRSPYETTFLTVLREDASEASARNFLALPGLAKLALEHRIVIGFPNPTEAGWNYTMDPKGPDDVRAIAVMQNEYASQKGMFVRDCFHPMHYAKYFLGIGAGASMANTFVALDTRNIAGLVTFGGTLCREAILRSDPAVTPSLIFGGDGTAEEFFAASCRAVKVKDEPARREYRSPVNPAQVVIAVDCPPVPTGVTVCQAWEELISKVRRTNTCDHGDIYPRQVRGDVDFEEHIDDTRLGDNNGLPHTWFTYIPTAVKKNPEKKVPLVVFGHGGSDDPAEAANMSCLHQVAEKHGFIVVFPWSGEKWGWNMEMRPDMPDDIAYIEALIKDISAHYPVDETRIYASGFSNGSAMMQVFSMVHPELIAAMFPNNTRWCQNREALPFLLAAGKKLAYDYRMPSWYTYGGRDFEYPVARGSGQQIQYDFWKNYNNIPQKPTPYTGSEDPTGVGVPGETIRVLYPDPTHPEHKYTVHSFYTRDEGHRCLYNYVMMHTKGHDCAPVDAELGWNFVKQFRRNPDGSLGIVEE